MQDNKYPKTAVHGQMNNSARIASRSSKVVNTLYTSSRSFAVLVGSLAQTFLGQVPECEEDDEEQAPVGQQAGTEVHHLL